MSYEPDERIWMICETTDGGRTIAIWASTIDQIDQLRTWLGEPDVETIASAEVMSQANVLSEQAVHVWRDGAQ